MKKIAFCFLIYDGINQEELWHHFFKNVDKNKYSIYIHYKYNKPLTYFEHCKINNGIPTKYENETIPLAYNVVLRNAYMDADNYKFIMVSGSCVPFKSFDFMYNQLMNDNYGYFTVCPPIQCFPNCNSLLNVMERKFIAKSHNWFILNRKLLENLCFDKDDILKQHFNTIYAPAEYFYYTFVKLLNLENEIITSSDLIPNDNITFTNWGIPSYKYPSTSGFKTYSFFDEEELDYLLNSKCFFGRKVDSKCPLLANKKYMDCITSA